MCELVCLCVVHVGEIVRVLVFHKYINLKKIIIQGIQRMICLLSKEKIDSDIVIALTHLAAFFQT